jgi:hypothetical protein
MSKDRATFMPSFLEKCWATISPSNLFSVSGFDPTVASGSAFLLHPAVTEKSAHPAPKNLRRSILCSLTIATLPGLGHIKNGP